MTQPGLIVEGRGRHKHIDPLYMGIHAQDHGWNTVVKSKCGHYYVRRYTWFQALFPLHDHWPDWKRLRFYHVGALLRMLWR